MKKIISIFLALIMTAALFAVPSSAAAKTKVWNGKVITSWYTGKKDSYDISSPGQLAGLAKLVNEGKIKSGVVINLTADIVLNNTSGWEKWYKKPPKNKFTPIGASGNPVSGYYPFSGVFNGNGHTISGLYVNNAVTAGLFGYLKSAVIANVIIDKSVIIGYDNKKNKGAYAGGIAGIVESSVINKCENEGYVYCKGQPDIASGMRTAYAGGIAGSIHTEDVSAEVLAAMMAAGGVFANPYIFTDGNGGLIKGSGIINCISSGYVYTRSGVESYNGGIAGWGNNGAIKNCIAWNGWRCEKGTDNRGKFYAGYICGGASNCSIENCYYWNGAKLNALADDWKSSVVPVKREAYSCGDADIGSSALAKKLGNEFKYTKGDTRIYLACDLRKKK